MAAACVAISSGGTLAMHAANEPRFVPDVVAQFNALTERPDPLGFYIGASPDPTTFEHYQGMVRLQGEDGTPYFLVSRCGVPFIADDVPGNLLVVRMDSRDKFGERMRSNRLERDRDLADTPPELADTTVAFISFNGETWPAYSHPGGMQLWGDVLAVAMEGPLDDDLPEKLILFIDVSDPENPALLSWFDPRELAPGALTGVVGITQLADRRFLMVLTGGGADYLWFFETTAPDPLDLRSPTLQWNLVTKWDPATAVLGAEWPTGLGTHQAFQFLREGDLNGALYLAGARGLIVVGDDLLDLYRVEFLDGAWVLTAVSSREMSVRPNADASVASPWNNTASFAAASTFYISPSGELIFYATEHENEGPGPIVGTFPNGSPIFNHSVKAGEWRHIDVVRPDSPTLRPHLTLFPPYSVPEGGTTVLTGFARPPITRPWIQLYTHNTFNGRYVVIDFADWEKDSFDNFKDLDGSLLDFHAGFSDEASSWRWFAPKGCTIRVNDHDFSDSGFPGKYTHTLHGTGSPESAADLTDVLNNAGNGNMNDELTSAEFFTDCDEYYSTFPELFWDTDRNGRFETVGYVAPFDATNLNGPSQVSARVLAIHPIDGAETEGAAIVHVYNVAPIINSMRVFDSLGKEVGPEVPFVLRKLPVTLRATFTDPGKPDRQGAELQWGNGKSDPHQKFNAFNDAFGGATGNVAHRHVYANAASYTLKLTVWDFDDGMTDRTTVLRVVTPAQAVEEIIRLVDTELAGTLTRAQRLALQAARKHLAGSANGIGSNGALDMLKRGQKIAALLKLLAATVDLHLANRAGADVDALINLVRQVELSVLVGG